MLIQCPLNIAAAYSRSLNSVDDAKEFFVHLRSCPQCSQKLRLYLRDQANSPSDGFEDEFFAYVADGWPQVGIVMTTRSLWAVTFGDPRQENLLAPIAQNLKMVKRAELPELGQRILTSIAAYLKTGIPLPDYELNLGLVKSAYQREVLLWTRMIPYGQTCTYGELAELMGRPGAARAVGGAQKANPLPLFIPCHRVVGSAGKLVGFGGGLELKQWLLNREQNYV